MSVYVLELENNKYYVGYKDKGIIRAENHFTQGGSSAWTRLHKPIKIISFVDGSKELEKSTTLEYMIKYGWKNVRGAGWTSINCYCPLELRLMVQSD